MLDKEPKVSKIQLNDFVYIGKLLSTYGGMLSQDRQMIMIDYFEYNMTLAEIAAQRNISRQAVLDAIDKACKKLKEFETTLKLCEKKDSLTEQLLQIKDLCNQNEVLEKVDKILKEI